MARKHIEHFATGSSDSMRNIAQGVITSIPVVLPEIHEQIRIAAQLKKQLAEIDDLAEANQITLNELACLPQHLLARAFNDREAP